MAAQQIGRDETLARLIARLDAQEEELVGLRATVAQLAGDSVPAPQPALPAVRQSAVRSRTATASRRTLLKGAGAALFTTALLATGEVVPITPYEVAATDPIPRPSGTASPAAVVPDTLYQTYVGTDFQPENTSDGYSGDAYSLHFGAGPVYQSTGTPANFSVRVDLPQGAMITEVIFYVLRNDANAMFVDMSRIDTSGGFNAVGSTLVSAISGGVQAISLSPLTNTTVDNGTYSYILEWLPGTVGGTQQLYGARVGYTLPSSAQVYGNAQAGIGVFGQSASGTAIKGLIPAVSASGTIAISGSNNATAANSHGIVGVATVGHGLIGNTNYTPPAAGGPPYYAGLVGNAPNGAYAGLFFGKVQITGTLNGHTAIMQQSQVAVAHPDGTHRLSYALSATENWIEDVGKGTLVSGRAAVKMDPAFATIADMGDYHVFLTGYDEHRTLSVGKQSAEGFEVVATSGDVSAGPAGAVQGSGRFSWRVMAKRKDGQAQRLATYTFPKLEAPHIPERQKP